MRSVNLHGKRVSVLGAARSGRAVAALLASAGARVLLSDSGPARPFRVRGVRTEFNGHTPAVLEADFMVVSPGVPTEAAPVQAALKKGLKVYSELEVAFWFCGAPVVAITGTNGKTTTTALIGYIFSRAGRSALVAGNIGTPLSACVQEASDLVVLEVSSFQLDHIATFRPAVSVLLNITPDHLDRYGGSFQRYAQSKLRITENQTGADVLVYNYDDSVLRNHVARFEQSSTVRVLPFSTHVTLSSGAYARKGRITLNGNALMDTEALALPGPHNVHNSLAAALAAQAMGVRDDVLRKALSGFAGVPHRLEFVRQVDGVRYINDSKATNVCALRYALLSYNAPIVLLAGGRDKGNDYSKLRTLVSQKVHTLVAFGESGTTVMRELGPFAPVAVSAETLEEATAKARANAKPGDVVLLSPACASFDAFENFEHRGEVFRHVVEGFGTR